MITKSMSDHEAIAMRMGLQHLDRITTALWVYDIDRSRVVWANRSGLNLWDAPNLEELTNRPLHKDMSLSVSQRLRQYQEDFESHNSEFTEQWTIYPNGKPTTVSIKFRGFRFEDDRMGMLCETLERANDTPDILRSAEALLHTSVMISLYGRDGMPLYCNPAARAGYHNSTVHLSERFVDLTDFHRLLERLKTVSGCRIAARVRTSAGVRWHEITARECSDAVSGETAYLLSENDISDLKETEQRVRYLADHDVLTGLPNRNYIQSQFKRLLKSVNFNQEAAFILLDLDRFKAVNDLLGHAAGDELLIDVSTRLKDAIGENGTLARLGGDEFLVWLPGNAKQDPEYVDNVCERILSKLEPEFIVNNHQFNITASIGVSRFPKDGGSLSALMKNADLALYDAKESGKNRYRHFTVQMIDRVERQVRIENDLRIALENQDFELYFQPRVATATGAVTGAEALVRWRHPTRGLIPPSQFIPICEETGLIVDLGAWVIEETARKQKAISEDGFEDLVLSLNLSARQFSGVNFMEQLLTLDERSMCDPSKIELEITETMLMSNDQDITGQLRKLRDKGFGIAIDDFGTGYSNLAYIQRYPLTSLKIDRTFISSIETHGAVTRMVMSLCKLIGVKAVAEGVETIEQLNWLRQHNCHEIQGYLFSKPLPFEKFKALLNDPPALPAGLQGANEDDNWSATA